MNPVAKPPMQEPDCGCEQCAGVRRFAARVARLADGLRRLGVKSGERVAMLGLDPECYLEYLFAVPRAGGALSLCNIGWTLEETAFVLQDSNTLVLLVDEPFAGMGEALKRRVGSLRYLIHTGEGPAPGGMYSYARLLADGHGAPAVGEGPDSAGDCCTRRLACGAARYLGPAPAAGQIEVICHTPDAMRNCPRARRFLS